MHAASHGILMLYSSNEKYMHMCKGLISYEINKNTFIYGINFWLN